VANNISNNVSVLLSTAARLELSLTQNPTSGTGSFVVPDLSSALEENTWYHVAFSYDPGADDNGDGTGVGTVKLYVNGVLTTTATGLGSLPAAPDISSASGTTFNVGDLGSDIPLQPLTGYLDDLSVWDDSLVKLLRQQFPGATAEDLKKALVDLQNIERQLSQVKSKLRTRENAVTQQDRRIQLFRRYLVASLRSKDDVRVLAHLGAERRVEVVAAGAGARESLIARLGGEAEVAGTLEELVKISSDGV
jgi:hypothetical protein